MFGAVTGMLVHSAIFGTVMRLLVAVCIILYLFFSCSPRRDNAEGESGAIPASERPAKESLPPSGLSGKALSEAHCSRCHAYVNPEQLPKAVWSDDVLPAMGHRLGIYERNSRPDSLFDVGASGSIVRKANIFPEKPMLAEEDWRKIKQYFIENAPDTIPPPVRKTRIRMGLKHFKYREASFSNRPPLTALVKILPQNRGIVYSDAKGPRSVLTFLTPDLQENYSMPLQTTPVQFHERSNEVYLTTIGKGVFPNDAPDGTLQRLERKWPEPKYKPANMIIQNLQRPVCMAYGDLNKDGLDDIVVCEFGNQTGRLAWYDNKGSGGYTKRILREQPGAITAIIKDANNDGLPDIYVLMAQGNEGVFLYENQGSGKFQEKRLLSFPPLNGSQYMELADFNKDGFEDILFVCGDNADLSPILKNYHGIYIYLNDGKSDFRQAYFYQMNGAYKAMVRDYDLDGNLDIAAISFFPDYPRYPQESFIYLRGTGGLKFQDYSFAESSKGRWIVMDAGDMDGDGDIDLVLGSFVYFLPDGDTTGLGKKWLSTSPSVVVLENTVR